MGAYSTRTRWELHMGWLEPVTQHDVVCEPLFVLFCCGLNLPENLRRWIKDVTKYEQGFPAECGDIVPRQSSEKWSHGYLRVSLTKALTTCQFSKLANPH